MTDKREGRPCLAAGTPSHRQSGASPSSDAHAQHTDVSVEDATRGYVVTRMFTWTEHTILCSCCGRTARVSAETIALVRAEFDCARMTDADVAQLIDLCVECVDGVKVPGEIVADAQHPFQHNAARIEAARAPKPFSVERAGEVRHTERDLSPTLNTASGGVTSLAIAASAAPESSSGGIAHPTHNPSFRSVQRRLAACLGDGAAPATGRAIAWREEH